MPNKQGGYGGYRSVNDAAGTARRVRTTGGGAHTPPPQGNDYYRAPYTPQQGGRSVRQAAYDPNELDGGWVDPKTVMPRTAPGGTTEEQGRTTYRAPQSRPQPVQGRSRPAAQRQKPRYTAAQRRNRARLTVFSVVFGLCALAGIITLLLPKNTDVAAVNPAQTESTTMTEQLVAPLPYNGAEGGTTAATAPALDWGFTGPIQQSESYTYTAAPAATIAVPEMGRVDNSWFADAAFLGDSLTVGFSDYGIDVGGALICGYEGTSPNQIVNRTTLNNTVRGEEIPLDVLGAAQPAKLYVLLGTNALVGVGNDDGFLNYYGRMLDDLKTTLPNTMIFVQSVLPVRPDALEKAPGLASDRLATIDNAIAGMCSEKGCYYLDLTEAFADDTGALSADIAQPDGIHITVAGYARWVNYLSAHVPYNINNPYQPGSSLYLDDSMKQLLADIPQ